MKGGGGGGRFPLLALCRKNPGSTLKTGSGLGMRLPFSFSTVYCYKKISISQEDGQCGTHLISIGEIACLNQYP